MKWIITASEYSALTCHPRNKQYAGITNKRAEPETEKHSWNCNCNCITDKSLLY